MSAIGANGVIDVDPDTDPAPIIDSVTVAGNGA